MSLPPAINSNAYARILIICVKVVRESSALASRPPAIRKSPSVSAVTTLPSSPALRRNKSTQGLCTLATLSLLRLSVWEQACALGPTMISFACSEIGQDSPMYRITPAFCFQNWHEESRVLYSSGDRGTKMEWEEGWDRFPAIRNELLVELNQADSVQRFYGSDLLGYLYNSEE
ncbi:hypothetical protein P171DRAFT_443910 [Karstenula rhodostoma CBS 690.94]|uniref:Uncharacterized protein n=1 Tax=Karstenula rhodostoma CBS 690.94 TaxID=1392251 RepID=A0A9P4PIW0_9PLEO|nr:hypothetical protein P171DRAFT_443910 [Karstenula rhodostoma CBS 690.94]